MQKKQLVAQPPPLTNVSYFHFGDHDVRVVTINEDPWWIAKDPCDVLDIKTYHAKERLDDDEKTYLGRTELGLPPGKDMMLINESGLYSLILGSRKPEAKAFKRWVTSEVLPAIRKTGRYAVADSYPPMTIDPMAVIRAAEEVCCSVLGLRPRASKAIARELGIKIGVPTKRLPVVPPYNQKIHQITAPRKQQDEKIAASIRARRKYRNLTLEQVGAKAFPRIGFSRHRIYSMERGHDLTPENIDAIDAVLGKEMPPTTTLTVATSIIDRFPTIPALCEVGLSCDKAALSDRERLMPARRLAIEIFEAWVG
ncbi:BRO family protein [Desulfoluna spongiiphila]|nr:BRO family protein [Desulfoluna spongiiphila]VVS95319.1 bro n-terminal domain [Desulfoluna spongiiphila]